jgi:hypothetical protein
MSIPAALPGMKRQTTIDIVVCPRFSPPGNFSNYILDQAAVRATDESIAFAIQKLANLKRPPNVWINF